MTNHNNTSVVSSVLVAINWLDYVGVDPSCLAFGLIARDGTAGSRAHSAILLFEMYVVKGVCMHDENAVHLTLPRCFSLITNKQIVTDKNRCALIQSNAKWHMETLNSMGCSLADVKVTLCDRKQDIKETKTTTTTTTIPRLTYVLGKHHRYFSSEKMSSVHLKFDFVFVSNNSNPNALNFLEENYQLQCNAFAFDYPGPFPHVKAPLSEQHEIQKARSLLEQEIKALGLSESETRTLIHRAIRDGYIASKLVAAAMS